jgi:hypothetical protein
MTEQNNPEAQNPTEAFIVGEWVTFYEGEERRKFQITEVAGSKVTVRVYGQPMTFSPRPSDGEFVKVGSPDHEVMPTMIRPIAPKPPKSKTSRLRDIRDFLWGMFWAPR